MATSVGAVQIDFAVEIQKANAGINNVVGHLKGFEKQLESLNKVSQQRLKQVEDRFGSLDKIAKRAAQAFSIAIITRFAKSAADAADQLGKTADKIGVSTEALKSFQIAASEAGVGMQQANKLLIEGQTRLGQAAAGTGEAAKFIKLLGLNVEDLQKLSPDELFKTYAESIGGLSTRSEQLAAANALMGESAPEAFTLIQAGAPAIDDAAAFVDRFGLALDRVDIKQIEQANDAIGRVSTVSQAASQRIVAGLAPAVEYFANQILNATGNTKDLQVATEVFGAFAITTFQVLANSVRLVEASFFSLKATISKVTEVDGTKLRSFATALPPPLMFAANLLGAAAPALNAAVGTVDENLAKAEEALSRVKSFQQIQEEVVRALEESRARAEAAVAAQSAAAGGGGLSLGGAIELTDQQNFDIANDSARAAADAQKEIAKDLSRSLLEEVNSRNEVERQHRQYILDQELATQQMLFAFRQQGAQAAQSLLTAYGGKYKAFAQVILGIEKASAIRSAFINTREAVTKVLAKYPPPYSYALAAGVAAYGAAQVAAIASGGGGSSSPSFGSPHNPVFTQTPASDSNQPVAATSQTVTQIVFTGPVFNNEQTRSYILDTIREAVNDRDVVVISPSSRQAADIREET